MSTTECVIDPCGPYRLSHMARGGSWTAPLAGGATATARQRADGRVVIRAQTADGIAAARFMLALDDDTTAFHTRFRNDPLLGASSRALRGFRPLRLATVTHSVVRAMCGQLVDARRARQLERSILQALGEKVATQERLAALAPAELRRLGLAQPRATTLARLAGTLDLEALRNHSTATVRARLLRERGVGPWSVGVIAVEGLGRFDHGIVGDLGLVKLAAGLWGRWPEAHETARLLEPYGEWQGLACEVLLRGAALGLVPGASDDAGRIARRRSRRVA
jgi:DNA-3-methyladenine glycosylase II